MGHEQVNERILVVDDAATTLEMVRRNLEGAGYQVYTASGVEAALSVLAEVPVDLVITDLKMPVIGGLDLVRHVRENFKNIEVMMITGYASIEGAVAAVKSGVDEYLAKPFTDVELLGAVVRTLEKLRERRALAAAHPSAPSSFGLLGRSRSMEQVYALVARATATTATVLITGESGTGKELVARAIHYNSDRAAAPFVPVNCGGIPEGLLESELFGHMKGAFTGATESRAGFFQTADGGSIFLDEISETSLAMQVKLLRVLENREVTMVGASKTRHVDVRILAATNKDLSAQVARGAFRDDLYFRLNVLVIALPPLRDRGEDIALLAQHFLARYARDAAKETPKLSPEVLDVLSSYNWPGNVRELQNVIQRLVIMTDGDNIDVPDLPSLMRFSAYRGHGVQRTLAEVEQQHIQNVLASVKGNKTRAAAILGIDRKTLREKLKAPGESD